MKIPRDISGEELARLLKKYGYEVTRQKGSHIRLTAVLREEHYYRAVGLPVGRELPPDSQRSMEYVSGGDCFGGCFAFASPC